MEGFLALVAGKVGSALADEAAKSACSLLHSEWPLLTEIRRSMSEVQSYLGHINEFLGKANTRRNNKDAANWLKEVRKIAQHIEDVIDEYTYLTAEESESKFIGIDCSAIKKATNCRAWCRIATQLKQIKEDVARVFGTMKQIFDIKIFDDGEGSNLNHDILSYDLEDDEIIGMEKEKETLIGWVTNEQHFIIAVWGMGGLGKTMLLKSAYKSVEIQRHFGHKVWVSVSQSFRAIDLLRRIYKSLIPDNERVEPKIEGLDLATLVEKTQAILRDSRFLVILDDIWDPYAFFSMKRAFRNPTLGSKIVITTRSREVASLADEQCRMEYRTLSREEAWKLFCNMAFWKDLNRRCPQEIEVWGRKIVDKCDGLPLAIVAIARLMSLKRQSDWKNVYDRLSWEFINNPKLDSVKHILNLSYYDLPGYLKNCFLYCSIFPEDSEMSRGRLIKLWVAEGFVQPRGAQTMEDVAEDYFNELVHRCMLQIAYRSNITGMVKACRMHDVIRELTLDEAKNENFSMVVTESQPSSSANEARRLSVHGCPGESMGGLSRIRALIVFADVGSPPISNMWSSKGGRYLRVLDLQEANISEVPNALGDLYNLHYLSLRETKISQLPNSVGKLRNLQTLDLRDTKVQSLPKGTTKLKNLRCLAAYYRTPDVRRVFLSAPRGLWNLTCLQRLQCIKADEEFVRRLGSLTLLRSLQISDVKGSDCRHLLSSLSGMASLSKLVICACNPEEPFQLVKEFDDHVLRNLVKLHLEFRLHSAEFPLLVDLLGDKLQYLCLIESRLRDDPLPKLSRLFNLVELYLFEAYVGERLCFGTGWFPKLKILVLNDLPNLDEIKLEKGSTESLQELRLLRLYNLKQVPQGVEFQESIKLLVIMECNPLLVRMVKGEQKCKVNHIPNFFIRSIGWRIYCR